MTPPFRPRRRARALLAATMLAATALSAAAAPPADDAALRARVERLLTRAPVIDGHNDLPWEIRERFAGRTDALPLDRDASALPHAADAAPLMTDWARARTGHLGGQFWSVWIPADVTGPRAVEMTIEQIDLVHRLAARFPDQLEMAGTAADVARIRRAGRIASLIGIEGGHQIDSSMAVMRRLYDAGARYMTLTHAKANAFADSATDAPVHGGLTAFGRALVVEMNRTGMLVDLSHVAPQVMRDALATTRAPVIFSHSGAFAVDPHPRNVPDDVLDRMRANGGVVMVNFYPPFVSDARRRWEADRAGEEARQKALHLGAPPAEVAAALRAWEASHPRPVTTVAMVADHVDHIAARCGTGCVGIGSDFDGIPDAPQGLDSVALYPALFVELARRGWSDAALAGLAGDNVLRALAAAERVAARLQRTTAPDARTLADLDPPPAPSH